MKSGIYVERDPTHLGSEIFPELVTAMHRRRFHIFHYGALSFYRRRTCNCRARLHQLRGWIVLQQDFEM